MVIPLRDFIALRTYLQQFSLWLPWRFGALFCFNWSSSKLQSNSGFWNTYEINSVSHSAWPCFTLNILKHKYLLLCETTYTFLCGFVALLFLCCSCEQLAADPVCLCSGCSLSSPLVPVLQTEPAGQLLLEPTLQLQHISARVPAPAALLGGSPWRGGGPPYCFTSPPVQLMQMWCDISFETSCSWRVVVAQLQGPEKAI